MIAYVDASVVLRIVLKDLPALSEWGDLKFGVVSPLVRVECRRKLDRLWHRGELGDESLIIKQQEVEIILGRFDIVPLDQRILDDASLPLPMPLRTLDAIHLSSALTYRRHQPAGASPIVMATHDHALAKAPRAMNLAVIGVE